LNRGFGTKAASLAMKSSGFNLEGLQQQLGEKDGVISGLQTGLTEKDGLAALCSRRV